MQEEGFHLYVRSFHLFRSTIASRACTRSRAAAAVAGGAGCNRSCYKLGRIQNFCGAAHHLSDLARGPRYTLIVPTVSPYPQHKLQLSTPQARLALFLTFVVTRALLLATHVTSRYSTTRCASARRQRRACSSSACSSRTSRQRMSRVSLRRTRSPGSRPAAKARAPQS